ncbi:MAG: sterol desaturase family protein [Deltaproteobacteria bacterium]|nr:sterol desaturase family protein [Deltaproteobacteria bacterium]
MGAVVAILVLAGLYTAIERKFRRRRLPNVPGSRLVDLLYWPLARVGELGSAATVLIWALGLSIVSGLGPKNVERWLAVHFHDFDALPRAVQVVVALVAVDLVGYWVHRAIFHMSPLWRFHAIHHSAERLDWLAAARNHPLAPAISALAHAAPLVVVGIDPRVVGVVSPIFGLWAIFIHANVPFRFGRLRYVIATPMFHRWHHAHLGEHARGEQGVNFAAMFPIWDLVFGTFYCPAHEPHRFGTEEPVPKGILGQIAYPFRRSP